MISSGAYQTRAVSCLEQGPEFGRRGWMCSIACLRSLFEQLLPSEVVADSRAPHWAFHLFRLVIPSRNWGLEVWSSLVTNQGARNETRTRHRDSIRRWF